MAKILVVEDEGAIRELLLRNLRLVGHQPQGADSLPAARELLERERFDLMLLDIMLGKDSGFDLLEQERETPVICLTAKGSLGDKLRGLHLGADDYIVKPFSLAILRARVRARLRGGQTPPVEIGPFVFDFARMEYRKNGRAVELSRTEQKLLRLLVSNRGATLSRGELVDRIWTDGAAYVDENALSVTVKRLRDKLEDTPSSPQYIKTVYGVGYTWAVRR